MSTKTVVTSRGVVKLTMNGCVSLHNIWATLNDAPLMSWMPEDKSAVDVDELVSHIGYEIAVNNDYDWGKVRDAIDELVNSEYNFVNAVDLW
jgi:erythromycin esterase-like protein